MNTLRHIRRQLRELAELERDISRRYADQPPMAMLWRARIHRERDQLQGLRRLALTGAPRRLEDVPLTDTCMGVRRRQSAIARHLNPRRHDLTAEAAFLRHANRRTLVWRNRSIHWESTA